MHLLEDRVLPALERPEVLTITFMLCLNLFVPLKCYIQYPFLSFLLLFMGSLHLFKHSPQALSIAKPTFWIMTANKEQWKKRIVKEFGISMYTLLYLK